MNKKVIYGYVVMGAKNGDRVESTRQAARRTKRRLGGKIVQFKYQLVEEKVVR